MSKGSVNQHHLARLWRARALPGRAPGAGRRRKRCPCSPPREGEAFGISADILSLHSSSCRAPGKGTLPRGGEARQGGRRRGASAAPAWAPLCSRVMRRGVVAWQSLENGV